MKRACWIVLFLLFPTLGHVEPPMVLKLDVSLDSEVYSLNDTIEPRIKVTNRGRGPVAFWNEFTWDAAGTIDFVVMDDSGKALDRWITIDDHILARGKDDNESRIVILKHGESVMSSTLFLVTDLVLRPGSYTLLIRYLAPIVESEPQAPFWDREAGPLVGSATFRIVSR